MSLEKAIEIIRQEFGQTAIRTLDEIPSVRVSTIDTGSMMINQAIGCGGWPRGHIIELFGEEASGKTTLCYHAIVSEQVEGKYAAFIDVEHRVDLDYAKAIGVDPSRLIFSQPTSGEEGLKIVKTLLQNKAVGLIVIDSIAALTPQVMIDGEFIDANIGAQARLVSKALREFSQLKTFSNCCLLFTNQLRERPGVMYGSPIYQPGGRGPKFYSSVRAQLKKKAGEDAEGNPSHNICTIKFVKNSCGPPFKEAEFNIIYGQGIDQASDVLNFAEQIGIIQKKGSWFQIKSQGEFKNFAQGKEKAVAWVKEGRLEKIREAIHRKQKEK